MGNNYPLWYGIEKRNYNGNSIASCPFRAYVYPTLVEGRKLLTSTSTTTFDKDDITKKISQTVSYTYNNSSHLQLVSTKESNSKGDEIITTSTYPLDYSDIDADLAILQMKGDKFMHSSVITNNRSIQKAGMSNKLLISSIINKYQITGNNVLPKEVATLETTTGITEPIYQPISNSYPANYKPKI